MYKTIILPVVLYGCETWSLTLREESRLRVYENRILRRIFGLKKDENREWRLHNEEIHSLCRSPNTVRMIKSRRVRMCRRWVLLCGRTSLFEQRLMDSHCIIVRVHPYSYPLLIIFYRLGHAADIKREYSLITRAELIVPLSLITSLADKIILAYLRLDKLP